MSAALAPALIVAALVLCVAGVSKLRAPAGAAAALGSGPWSVRTFAVGEVALGAACLLWPGRVLAVAVAIVYALLAGVAAVLMRRRVACGCFGENDFPVSPAHVIASGLLGTVALAASLSGARGLTWAWGRPVPQTAVLLIGIAGAVYAVVLVFTVLPRAWAAWGQA